MTFVIGAKTGLTRKYNHPATPSDDQKDCPKHVTLPEGTLSTPLSYAIIMSVGGVVGSSGMSGGIQDAIVLRL